MKNKGISLIVLVVTIVVIVILVSTVLITLNNSTQNAILVTFSEELSVIEQGVRTYYLENEKFPIVEGTEKSNKDEVLSLVNLQATFKTSLENEIIINGDASAEFYQVDLSKLNITRSAFGNKTLGENDIYVISNNFNAYYLKGVKFKNEMYFSLSNYLYKSGNAQVQYSTSITRVEKISGITVSSNVTEWTNIMGVKIFANLASDESIYFNISGINNEKQVTTIIGINDIAFDNLNQIKSITNITDEEISNFENLTTDKYIEVIKKKNGVDVGKIKIDLAKYDVSLPYLEENLSIIAQNEENICYLKVSDGVGSKINMVKFEYLTKINELGAEVPYFANITEFDNSYLLLNGKKVIPGDNGKIQIKMPKEVIKIQIVLIDNAGNVRSIVQSTKPDIFANMYMTTLNIENVIFNLVINSLKGISSVETEISFDGLNYTNKQNYTSLATGNNVVINCGQYTNMDIKSEFVYIKATVTDNNSVVNDRKTEIRIQKFKL